MAWTSGLSAGGKVVMTPLISMVADRRGLRVRRRRRRRKLVAYLDFARSGHVGPDGITPRVLLTVPDGRRLAAVRDLVETLPEPAGSMIGTVGYDQAVATMIDALRC